MCLCLWGIGNCIKHSWSLLLPSEHCRVLPSSSMTSFDLSLGFLDDPILCLSTPAFLALWCSLLFIPKYKNSHILLPSSISRLGPDYFPSATGLQSASTMASRYILSTLQSKVSCWDEIVGKAQRQPPGWEKDSACRASHKVRTE